MSAITDTMAESDWKRDFDLLRNDMRDLRADFRGLLRDAATVGRERAGQAHERLDEQARAATQLGQDTVEMLREEIEDHPWGTMAAAFCAGILAGSFFLKRG